jgi:hypothetical protein
MESELFESIAQGDVLSAHTHRQRCVGREGGLIQMGSVEGGRRWVLGGIMHGEGGHHVMGAPMRRHLCFVCALRKGRELRAEWGCILPVVNAEFMAVCG